MSSEDEDVWIADGIKISKVQKISMICGRNNLFSIEIHKNI
ncbi:hypothetical protein BB14905_13605 [Bacillus sp. B14905]|nr:hypothetical protein BB14905_13605 [Bacillus sp. B14905]